MARLVCHSQLGTLAVAFQADKMKGVQCMAHHNSGLWILVLVHICSTKVAISPFRYFNNGPSFGKRHGKRSKRKLVPGYVTSPGVLWFHKIAGSHPVRILERAYIGADCMTERPVLETRSVTKIVVDEHISTR